MFCSSSLEVLLNFSEFFLSLFSTFLYLFPESPIAFLFLFSHISSSEFSLYSMLWNLHFYLYFIHLFALYISIFYILVSSFSSPECWLYLINAIFSFASLNILMMFSFLIFSSPCTDCFLHIADFFACLELLLHASGFLQTSRNLGLPAHI